MKPGEDSESEETCGRFHHPQKNNSEEKITGHKLHRSAVRPFFCCGSQISLTSINELRDTETTVEEELEDSSQSSSDCDGEVECPPSMSSSLLSLSRRGSLEKSRHPPNAVNARRQKKESTDKSSVRKKFWTQKLRGKLVEKRRRFPTVNLLECPGRLAGSGCVCTSYRRTNDLPDNDYSEPVPGPSDFDDTQKMNNHESCKRKVKSTGKGKSKAAFDIDSTEEFLKSFESINFDELYPIHDIDEIRIAERRREMAEGIEVSKPGAVAANFPVDDVLGAVASLNSLKLSPIEMPICMPYSSVTNTRNSVVTSLTPEEPCYGECVFEIKPMPCMPYIPGVMRTHSQADYIHCLVPDLVKITNSNYYWGVMDRYEAERLLHNKPEGTFLLRDSAQDEFLFSVSFRRYGRSLHARIEQWSHKFSFDSHDPGVFASDTVCGLIEHYKDPSCCMFFEPMLTLPLSRTFPFSLQQMSRAVIASHITYDGIDYLPLPKSLRQNLQYYHYKQKVRVRRFDTPA